MGNVTKPSILRITGGQPLSGTIVVQGAKNAASKILLATLLSSEDSVIENVPDLGDTDVTRELLEHVGATIQKNTDGGWKISPADIRNPIVPALSRQNRIPILALGPMLYRLGEVEVPVVGGDLIGPRPTNFHEAALRMMGAKISSTQDRMRATAQRLQGASITLPYPSVGATENIILAAVGAQGKTFIRNAAVEPEVLDLVQMLQTMGAIIELGTNRTFTIEGVKQLHGTRYRVMPDRNEAVSFACAALATQGDVFVRGARQDHMISWLNTVRRMGGKVEVASDGIRFTTDQRLKGIDVETDTHPGFMTDWQQPLVTVLTQAEGVSTIHETVYEDRFGYTGVLKKMGAAIETTTDCFGTLPCRWWARGFVHSASITGPTRLHAVDMEVPDIRAGMAHVIAALVAEGTSQLSGIEHLDRGYVRLDKRLGEIGARLERREHV